MGISNINDVKIEKNGIITHFSINSSDKEQQKSNIKIKPHIKIRDFNNLEDEDMHYEENKPISGIEIGLKIKF